jgi:hypothetical protein
LKKKVKELTKVNQDLLKVNQELSKQPPPQPKEEKAKAVNEVRDISADRRKQL